jgi:hypothetical protein
MPDRSTTRFMTRVLRGGALPFAQVGLSFGMPQTTRASGMPERFVSRLPRDGSPSFLDQARGFSSMQRSESSPTSRHELDSGGTTSFEESPFRPAEDEVVKMSNRNALAQSLPEAAAREYAASVPAPSLAPEAGIIFHPQELVSQMPTRSGRTGEEVERTSSELVEALPQATLSLPSPDQAHEEKRGRSNSRSWPSSRQQEVEPPPGPKESRREFRIIDPVLPSRLVQSDSLADQAQNRSTEDPYEAPAPRSARTLSAVNEPAFEHVSREGLRTDAQPYGAASASAGEASPADAWRPHRSPIHQERGARVTINQLDIQIINHQQPPPQQPPSRVSGTGGDRPTGIDRQLLGRFDLNA